MECSGDACALLSWVVSNQLEGLNRGLYTTRNDEERRRPPDLLSGGPNWISTFAKPLKGSFTASWRIQSNRFESLIMSPGVRVEISRRSSFTVPEGSDKIRNINHAEDSIRS